MRETRHKLNDFVKERWGKIFKFVLLHTLANIAISGVLTNLTRTDANVVSGGMLWGAVSTIYASRNTTSFAVFFTSVLIVPFVHMLTLEIYDSYTRERIEGAGELTVKSLIKNVDAYYMKLLPVALMVSAVNFMLAFVPVVGFLLIVIFNLGMTCVPFIVIDGEYSGIDVLFQSWEQMQYHKMELFKLIFPYQVTLWMLTLAVTASFTFIVFFGLSGINLTVPGFTLFISGGLLLFTSVYFTPYIWAAPAVYYAEHIE